MNKLTPVQRKRILKEFGHIPTKEELFAKIMASQQRMVNALHGAWNTAPDDPETRSQLSEVVARTAKLQTHLKKVFEDKKTEKSPPPLTANKVRSEKLEEFFELRGGKRG